MRDSLHLRFISSLEKCFTDERFDSKPELRHISMLQNEHLSVQLLMEETDDAVYDKLTAGVRVVSPLADCVTLRSVEQVHVPMAMYHGVNDGNLLRTEPGLYPDLLAPLRYHGCALIPARQLCCLWVDVRPEGKLPAGVYPLTLELYDPDSGALYGSATLSVEIVGALLPEPTLLHTQWFYVDCLADYYHVPMYSERHWEIIENFLKAATDGGVNMILTPVFTVPLDTAVGRERPTHQLVEITVENGVWHFDFEKLNRFIDLLLKYRVKAIEICHLFTQWGAAHAPKIMATVDGEYRRIFGWDTEAGGEAYGAFLRRFLPQLLEFLRRKGVDGMCRFHISDEPSMEHWESYCAARAQVADLLKGYPIMDALSSFEFYRSGAVEYPVPANNHIEPFLEAGVPHLWTYYCCVQHTDVSNRMLAMPSARNRILGVQLYKYRIEGFLHWGFNSYYNRYADSLVNPFQDPCGDYFVPAGDAFCVYPKADGTALDTLHFLVLKEAFTDVRALQLCEQLYDREFVMHLIEDGLDAPITFSSYPRSADYLLQLRERVNAAIRERL